MPSQCKFETLIQVIDWGKECVTCTVVRIGRTREVPECHAAGSAGGRTCILARRSNQVCRSAVLTRLDQRALGAWSARAASSPRERATSTTRRRVAAPDASAPRATTGTRLREAAPCKNGPIGSRARETAPALRRLTCVCSLLSCTGLPLGSKRPVITSLNRFGLPAGSHAGGAQWCPPRSAAHSGHRVLSFGRSIVGSFTTR